MIKDKEAKEVFDCLVRIKAGNGRNTLFWTDGWINGRRAKDFAPGIVATVSTRAKNSRTVAQGLLDKNWLADVPGTLA